ncbi:MAG TPA: hypothetical protein VH063_05260 [Gaiellaceae bacterium]|nr:hypothetical protein [Gaiellaceae bacterium]
MSRRLLSVPILLGFVAASAVPGAGFAARADTYPAMYVAFQQNHTFAITLADGTPVGTTSGAPTVIPAGSYQLFLNDTSGSVMQFDLSGPGVSLVTNMTNGEDLAASYVETFQTTAAYTYRDDYQQSTPVWSFTTSSATVSPTPTTGGSSGGGTPPRTTVPVTTTTSKTIVGSTQASVPFRGTLDGAVSRTGKLTLALRGKAVGALKAGEYTFKVTDRSKKAGFNVQEIRKGARAVTSTTFVGTRSLKLDLRAGQWFVYPTFLGKKTFFIVTA